jgi:pyruvate dehydrogenase E2 component (dihydrolipoamide acetyltransferase)
MPFTVTMPKLSPTMEEGTIAKWHKKEGEKVQAGQLLMEVATDKATVEYNALDEGYLRKILIKEGQNATVNQAIAIFSESLSENIDSYQPQGLQPIIKEESKETIIEVSEPTQKIQPKTISVTQPSFTPEPALENYTFKFPTDDLDEKIKASPLAKKLAKEKGVDLSSVKGTGPGGRVTSKDLDLGLPDQVVNFSKREVPQDPPGSYEEIALTSMRKVIANRLQQSKSYIPHIYVRLEVDAEPLVHARQQLKEGNVKVSLNDFVIRACSLSLKEHPNINTGFNSETQSIIQFKTIDVCVAVSVDQGLITPIIRHADFKNLGEIAVEIKELASRAKLGKLQPHEYKGGSFTISNMGMFGILDFCAIINPPQAAILAVGSVEECPVVKNGAVVVGKKMSLILSADHRVIDGKDAAIFLKTLQKYLENPALLLI